VASLPADAVQMIGQSLSLRYAHEAAARSPSKQTATQRKGREKDAEAAEFAQLPKKTVRNWRSPSFVAVKPEATAFGTAMHQCLQYIRYAACTDENGVKQEVYRLVQEQFLSQEQADMVDCGKIAAFFATDLGQKLRRSENVLREFKFSILDDGRNYDPALAGEQILLQGVVDCALIEEDGITVVDFKTDRVTEQILPERAAHYRPQVLAYASALERIYQKPVRETLLYFFHMDRLVSIVE
jgi:ATP-dependent helicase/nuclease subunit A